MHGLDIPCTNRAEEGLLGLVGRNSHRTSWAVGLNGAFIRINSHAERADVEWFTVDTISSLPRGPWCTEMVRIVLPSNSHVMTSQDSLVLQLKCTALSRNTVTIGGSSWIREATAKKKRNIITKYEQVWQNLLLWFLKLVLDKDQIKVSVCSLHLYCNI